MITIATSINTPIAQVWAAWNNPEIIQMWNEA